MVTVFMWMLWPVLWVMLAEKHLAVQITVVLICSHVDVLIRLGCLCPASNGLCEHFCVLGKLACIVSSVLRFEGVLEGTVNNNTQFGFTGKTLFN